MEKIIFYTNHLPLHETKAVSFMELLLDDTWVSGQIICPDSLYSEIGYINTKLKEKQNYEFLLRAAKKFPIYAVGSDLPVTASINAWEAFRTDCYVISKYQSELREVGLLDNALEVLINCSKQFSSPEYSASLLEEMMSQTSEYYRIDDDTRPILLYKSTDPCYGVLNSFTDNLAAAFSQCHQRVEILDVRTEYTPSKYITKHYKAIIGFQTDFFSTKIQNSFYLHDLIVAPKFNMVLDYPLLTNHLLSDCPQNLYLLIHDRNYIRFINTYYNNFSGCFPFSPAGIVPNCDAAPKKIYDIIFIGSYRDYRFYLSRIASTNREIRFLFAYFLHVMRHNPNITIEAAFKQALNHYKINLDNKDFFYWLQNSLDPCLCINAYYREKTIKTLLDSGIEVHVYGESWNKAPFATHPGLFVHPSLSVSDSLTVMQQSKICLNLMTFHRDGFTERIANTMLCRSVCLSENSSFLEETFKNGEEIVLFDLTNLKQLPQTVKELLANDSKLEQISTKGYEKAFNQHQWIHRAKQFLDILDTIT